MTLLPNDDHQFQRDELPYACGFFFVFGLLCGVAITLMCVSP